MTFYCVIFSLNLLQFGIDMFRGIRYLIAILLAGAISFQLSAQEKKLYRGFDGGMLVHTGYLSGNISTLSYNAKGAPIGIGGVARVHLGSHWRIGAEGYVSKLSQLHNGSYIRYGWGGILADFYYVFGRWMPYLGFTVGGGKLTHLLMFEPSSEEWGQVRNSVYHSSTFLALDPYLGCDYTLSNTFHLTLRVDCLNGIGQNLQMPKGPRFYIGFLFYH